ncbi:MAG: hydrogenase maturation nickel metallochaperone HypA [Saprospiraceae bacterium]|nr:hydrogenase maturation nickel metallochaperone HypA [Saprospiraceae bacterium]
MHELSIAMGIVNIADAACKKANKSSVSKICLEIGRLSGVEIDALNFVWPAAVERSVLSNAEKEIEIIEGEALCLECSDTFQITNHYDACPSCGSYFKDIQKGGELKVKYIEAIN